MDWTGVFYFGQNFGHFLTEVELLAFTTDYFHVVLVYDIFYDIYLRISEFTYMLLIRVTSCNRISADIVINYPSTKIKTDINNKLSIFQATAQ